MVRYWKERIAIPKTAAQERMVFEDNRLVPLLYGEQNSHLRKIEDALPVEIQDRGNEIVISGEAPAARQAREVIETLWGQILKGQEIDSQAVDSALRFLRENGRKANGNQAPGDSAAALQDYSEPHGVIVTKKRKIQPRSPLQGKYIQALQRSRMTFGVGPAGTGKTYLAVAMAVSMLEQGKVERIILTRPAVEAGERIGFLPGELKEKMDPYMRPLYDALNDSMYGEKVQKKLAAEEIEIAPLAFMRGRTLNNAFIILDEAQNATQMQMLMFLTRMGENSYMAITGDPTQTDLPRGTPSGLVEALGILEGTEGIEFIQFGHKDVVRHPLVAKVIEAYHNRRKTDA
jgi:phosphate starvation-inducible PhoH-like protein